MFYYYKLDSNNNLHIDFINLLKKGLRLLETKKKLVDLVWMDNKSDRIENLIDKYEKKTQISSATKYSIFLPHSTFQLLVAIFIFTIYSGLANFWLIDKKIDQLIEMI